MTLSRNLKRRVRAVAGYTVFCLIAFAIFLYILFPREEIKNRLLYEIEKNTAIEIASAEDRWLHPMGISFKGVRLIKNEEARTSLAFIDQFTIEIPVQSILNLSPVSVFTADLYGGSARGHVTLLGSDRKVEANWTNIDLSRIERLKEVPAEFAGKLSGDISLKLSDNIPQGQVKVLLREGKLGKIKIMGFPVPDIPIEEIQGFIDIKGQTLTLQDVRFKNSDIKGAVKGDIRFLPETGSGELDLAIRFSLGETMRKEYQGFLSFIEKSKDRAGFYNIKISGNFERPNITI